MPALICAKSLNTLGLGFDIAGALLLWIFVAEINFADRRAYLEGNGVLAIEDPSPEKIRAFKMKVWLSRLGALLLIIGFALQAISNYIP